MSQRQSFYRKVSYFVTIAILLVPLSWLSRPATSASDRHPGDPGGHLAQLRSEHQLSQANLGQIDPTSETLKLATLGFRGVAVAILWTKVDEYKKHEDWARLESTLQQIMTLMPNFVRVWRYQAWNISYNVSVEFDDYRDRYHYVKQGLKLLVKGAAYNAKEPHLLADIGWFTSQKIGRSDEKREFRRLFADDTDFHEYLSNYIDLDQTRGPNENKPDSWLAGRMWYLKAEKLVDDNEHITVGGVSPALFYEDSAKCQINFADTIQKDGFFGEVAERAWRRSAKLWKQYGDRTLELNDGRTFRLNEVRAKLQEIGELSEQLDALQSGLRTQMRAERTKDVPPDLLKAMKIKSDQRSALQRDLAERAERLILVSPKDLAEQMDESVRGEAITIADVMGQKARLLRKIQSDRGIVNYDAWAFRCLTEQSEHLLKGRQRLHEANVQYKKGRLDSDDPNRPGAQQLFEAGFRSWAAAFKEYPALYYDEHRCEDLLVAVDSYRRRVLDGGPLPKDFSLAELLRRYAKEPKRRRGSKKVAPKTGKTPAKTEQTTGKDAKTKPAKKDPAGK